jgi:phosphotransferase family enzyme
VLKRTRLDTDWTARRTDDVRGRESLASGQTALWDVFVCPYIASAVASGEVRLLLHDLSSGLLPDVREPLSESQESALLGALSRLHARFWEVVPETDWLVRPAQFCDLLAPGADCTVLSSPMRENVPRGWALALARLPAGVARHLTSPGLEWEESWADLPWTFLHGDTKVANFALMDGRVAAFDWAIAGTGPCAIDLGWYLAVNASRLTASKETIMMRYREMLETALGNALPNTTWKRLENVAVVCGARMLLWSKALALDAGRPGAADEWNWWVERLAG